MTFIEVVEHLVSGVEFTDKEVKALDLSDDQRLFLSFFLDVSGGAFIYGLKRKDESRRSSDAYVMMLQGQLDVVKGANADVPREKYVATFGEPWAPWADTRKHWREVYAPEHGVKP